MSGTDPFEALRRLGEAASWASDEVASDEVASDEVVSARADRADDQISWLERAEAGTEVSQLGRAYAALSDTDRLVVLAAVWDGMGSAGLAVLLDVGPDAAADARAGALRRFGAAYVAAGSGGEGSPDEAVARLRDRNPIPDVTALPDVEDDPDAQALLARIVGGAVRDRRTRRSRRALAGIAVVVAAAGSAAGAWITTSAARNPTQVGCYQQVDLHASVAVTADTSSDPVSSCRAQWTTGSFAYLGGTAPPLVACVLPSGIVGVFPATHQDPCNDLGLAHYEGDPGPYGREVNQLQSELSAAFGICVPVRDGAGMAERDLAALGLKGWRVTTLPPAPERPCSSLSLDPPGHTLTIVPVPRPPLSGEQPAASPTAPPRR